MMTHIFSELLITEGQRHFGVNGGLVGDDQLGFAPVLDFVEIGKHEANLFSFFRNQEVEVFDVFGRFQIKWATHFPLQDLAGGLEQTSPWGDGVAWEVRLIDGV